MKTILLKSNKIGDGELGDILAKGFLNAILEQQDTPKSIICVNSAVLLTTSSDKEIIDLLQKFIQKGIQIYSCGTCLDYYKLRDELKVGISGNAMDIAKALLKEDIVSL